MPRLMPHMAALTCACLLLTASSRLAHAQGEASLGFN